MTRKNSRLFIDFIHNENTRKINKINYTEHKKSNHKYKISKIYIIKLQFYKKSDFKLKTQSKLLLNVLSIYYLISYV